MIFPAFSPVRVFGHLLLLLLLPLSLLSGFAQALDNPLQPMWLSQSSWLPQGTVYNLHQWAAYGWLLLALLVLLQRLFSCLHQKTRAGIIKRKNTFIRSLYFILSAQILSGIWLYLSAASLVVSIHYLLAIAVLALVLGHTFEQLILKRCRYLWQVLLPKKVTRAGAAVLLVSGLLAVAIVLWDRSWHQPLRVGALPALTALDVDGEFDEPYWKLAPTVTVITAQGNDYQKAIPVEIRALHNGLVAYFCYPLARCQ